MSGLEPIFRSGEPKGQVRKMYGRAAGNEIASGKFASPQSSVAPVANGFGWFLNPSAKLQLFPPVRDLGGLVRAAAIERKLRFPWSGGRHPWLDAVVLTDTHVIGVESKRYAPYRDSKVAELANVYDRDAWGERMEGRCTVRDLLPARPRRYKHLDAARLVKHALGLATESIRSSLSSILVYLYAEPQDGCRSPDEAFLAQRREIEDFRDAVAGNRVCFAAYSWLRWLACFTGDAANHTRAARDAFAP